MFFRGAHPKLDFYFATIKERGNAGYFARHGCSVYALLSLLFWTNNQISKNQISNKKYNTREHDTQQ